MGDEARGRLKVGGDDISRGVGGAVCFVGLIWLAGRTRLVMTADAEGGREGVIRRSVAARRWIDLLPFSPSWELL